ncbi:MAG TPA: SAM-dependent methyltransferase [Myxococcota bacterium]|nr:SAM-dependent methyltransferase [Myxococcota bacterium]
MTDGGDHRGGRLGASFRDPSGFVFERDGVLYRQVNRSYAADYDRLLGSGLYAALVEKGLLVAHEEVSIAPTGVADAYRILRPDALRFFSYPYEWCFGQLQDAALATLEIQRIALGFGMSLKDASAYNIQFRDGRPLLIDTLSFESYRAGSPWVAYRQFCEHFLAPLALIAYRGAALARLMRVHLDGIPLALARSLLPARAWLRLQLLLHIALHARYQRRFEAVGSRSVAAPTPRALSAKSFDNLLAALHGACASLAWEPSHTEWADYYAGDSYSEAGDRNKEAAVAEYLDRIRPATVWDLGGNTGRFSRIASERGSFTVCFDVDAACVERNYREMRRRREARLLPLVMDLVNPSPALGWAHRERFSLVQRSSADLVMALALIHHLAIANNVPLPDVAEFFASLAPHLVIEFVPKSDPKLQVLLATREDIFPDYTQPGFERAFAARFEIVDSRALKGSERAIYLMRRKL